MIRILLPFLFIAPPLVYGFASLLCARKFFHASSVGGDFHPPVTIIKPVKGEDAESFENFASFCRQDYPVYQIVFAIASSGDPAVPVIRRLMENFPETDLELVLDDRIYGPNYKVSNLINAYPKAKHDVIVICDSDIRVGPRFLHEVAMHFTDGKVGLVTSLYRSSGVRNIATALESMGFTADMIPNVLVALRLEGLTFALGASMAVRRSALEKIGGFRALADYLADDYQLGNMIHRAGFKLALSAYFVESVMQRESLRSVLSRQLRWARTMRASRAGGYFASVITQPAPAMLLALVSSGFSMAGWIAVLTLGAARMFCATVFSRIFVRDGIFPRYLWLLPVRDLLASAVWLLSFLGNRVVWRSRVYRVLPGGKIRDIGEPFRGPGLSRNL
ncbi:MAG: bacteriohopanetetrol glucosamine biosynthesis glycosyltransferase HpnI [Geobacteraceae bacterium]|nr:bacteriohopanetetrol glucosamine biosynthesis glycosyltransferase HpnI [Geobacteraceae bacterium]